jgi:hypothetical protein
VVGSPWRDFVSRRGDCAEGGNGGMTQPTDKRSMQR